MCADVRIYTLQQCSTTPRTLRYDTPTHKHTPIKMLNWQELYNDNNNNYYYMYVQITIELKNVVLIRDSS